MKKMLILDFIKKFKSLFDTTINYSCILKNTLLCFFNLIIFLYRLSNFNIIDSFLVSHVKLY
jgi:hypothetical protein